MHSLQLNNNNSKVSNKNVYNKNHWSFVCSADNLNITCYFVLTIVCVQCFLPHCCCWLYFYYYLFDLFSLLSPSAKKRRSNRITFYLSRSLDPSSTWMFHHFIWSFQFNFNSYFQPSPIVLTPFVADLNSKYFIRSLPLIADLMRYYYYFFFILCKMWNYDEMPFIQPIKSEFIGIFPNFGFFFSKQKKKYLAIT